MRRSINKCLSSVTIVFLISGCGKLSNVVDVAFKNDNSNIEEPVKSASTVGLSPAAGVRHSGQFRLDAAVGSTYSPILKRSGSFTLYGGIQGQVVSQ